MNRSTTGLSVRFLSVMMDTDHGRAGKSTGAGALGRAWHRGGQSDKGVAELFAVVVDEPDARLPIDARASVIVLAAQLEALQTMLGPLDKRIKMQHRANDTSKRLETIPGIGIIGATVRAPHVTVHRLDQ